MQITTIRPDGKQATAPRKMNRLGRTAVASGVVVMVAMGGLGAAEAAPANVKAQKTTVFTPKHQGYVTPKAKRKAGILHAQVKLKGKYPKYYPMPWSWKITNKKLISIARGPMKCVAKGLKGKYHDTHPSIPVGYIWHSKVGSKAHPHKAKKVYGLSGTCVFPVQVGNKTGKATVGYYFKYAINPGKKVRASIGDPTVTSKVVLNK
ncbi:hypothetical protein ACWGGS_27910 [Streptomyces decoyicus]